MKKYLKNTLAMLLAAIMIFGIAPLNGINGIFTEKASAKDISSYKVGDVIEYGSYPQSRVTDDSLISSLDKASKSYSWISYEYTSGDYSSGDLKIKASDFMKYKDFSYNGAKYRAVYFTAYRPESVYIETNTSYGNQQYNGYYIDTIYYFKFEPIRWIVLDPDEGFVLSEIILDSQPFNDYYKYVYDSEIGEVYYGDDSCKYYANNYEHSSIREWLNDDFYNTAFSSSEKSQIGTSTVLNKAFIPEYSMYDSKTTYDKIFLLSDDEVDNEKYGFDPTNLLDRMSNIDATDYSLSQGLQCPYEDTYSRKNNWYLRTAGANSSECCVVHVNVLYFPKFYEPNDEEDSCYRELSVPITFIGIRPAFKFNPKATISTLDAPTVTLSNVASSGKIKATWNAVKGASSYKVYRATSKNGTYKLMKTTDSTSYINTSAVAGEKYYYKVCAVSSNGTKGEYSTVKSRTCDCARPVVTVSNVASSGKVKLTWNPVDGASSYKVYRAASKNGTYTLMKTTTSTSYVNSNSTAGKKYYYKVKAICYNTDGNSAYSSVKARTCDLAKPIVDYMYNYNGQPVLMWEKVDGAVSYRVYRATSQNGTYKLMKTTTSTTYTNTSVSHRTSYYYKVKAVSSNSDANSAYSNLISAYVK